MRATQINFTTDNPNTTNCWTNYNNKRRVTTAIDNSSNPEYINGAGGGLIEHFHQSRGNRFQ